MFAIIGIIVVFGAVIGGFLMEHGEADGADAAERVDHHRGSGDRHDAGGESAAGDDEDHQER
jgi:hypothetical protein